MSDQLIPVVPEAEALNEAYMMGYNRFEGAGDGGEGTDPLRAIDHFSETAEWANIAAPSLRALAGHADSGAGTYTVDRQAVVVPIGDEDDLPREGVELPASKVYRVLADAFRLGATDALDGRDADDSRTETIM